MINIFYKLKKRDSYSVKGDNGKVLIVAGSKDYPGSAILCAEAALRSGADLVYLASPEPVISKLNNPGIIPIEIKGDYFSTASVPKLIPYIKKCDCVVLGPGLTVNDKVKTFVQHFLLRNSLPIVIDADALKLIDLNTYSSLRRAVITPHKTEFKILFAQDADVQSCVSKASFEKDVIVVLKGAKDYVTNGKTVYINTTGNPGLTVGGTGDILAGVIGSFIAQGNSLYKSARTGIYAVCKTGDKLKWKYGYNYTPQEILELLPKIVKEFNS